MRIEKPVRDQTVSITCTEEEKEEIFRLARESGRTACGFIRWLVKKEAGKKEAGQSGEL